LTTAPERSASGRVPEPLSTVVRVQYRVAMSRSVICVSHEQGAGGRALAKAVAEELSYRLVDEEVMAHAADIEGVSVEELVDVEQRKSFFSRLMIDFGRSGAPAAYGAMAVPPGTLAAMRSPDQLRSAITTAIEEIAASGRVVIASHAASHLLSGDHVLRVLVVAPTDVRVARMAELQDLDQNTAADQVAKSDAGRRDYLKRFYNVDRESPDQYDLVVNTAGIDPSVLTSLIVEAAQH
jgi:cytidylate kinase